LQIGATDRGAGAGTLTQPESRACGALASFGLCTGDAAMLLAHLQWAGAFGPAASETV
jgi:hypothetical protein